MYSLADYTFPDTPFMIALGTSHTCGDCDGPTYGPTSVKITAYDRIADELGLELVKIGLSGCMNIDLLQATNELAHHKVLNDNCKLFMLEPRLGDRTVRLPVEAVVPGTSYVHKDILVPTGILEGWAAETKDQAPTIQQVSIDTRGGPAMNSHSAWSRLTGGNKNLAIEACIEAASFYSHSPLDTFDSVTTIDSIRHIVEANNVKFRWQIVNGRSFKTDQAKKLLGKHSTLFDKFINIVESSLPDIQEIKCGCGHYNKQGHKLWYENTIDHLR